MPQSHRQAAHDGDDGDLFLLRIASHQLIIDSSIALIVADAHPTGLAEHLAQPWRSLVADMTFTVILFTAFMTRRRQSRELTDLAPATKPTGIADLGAVDHRGHHSDAGLLGQLIHKRLMSLLPRELLDFLLHPLNLAFNKVQLAQQAG